MVGRTQPAAVKTKSSRAPTSRGSRLLSLPECESRGPRSPDWRQCVDRMTHPSHGLCAVVRSTVGLLPLLDTVVVREYTARTGCARPASRLRSSLPKLALNAASLRQMIHADRTYNSPLPFSDVHIECTGAGLCTHEPPQMHPDRVPFTYHLLSVHRQPILVAGTQNPELSLRPFPS